MAEQFKKINGLFEEFSPLYYQCEWDNSGWNIRTGEDVTGIYICLDVSENIIDAAKENGCNVILSHHPLIFDPVSEISDTGSVGRRILKLIKNGISLFSAHTTLDSAPWGINAFIADAIGLENREFLEKTFENEAGIGYIGDASYQDGYALADTLKQKLGLESVRIAGAGGAVKRIGLCSGAMGSLIDEAFRRGADAVITGEIKHNYYVDYPDKVLIEGGHYGTEKCFVGIARDYLQKRVCELKYNVKIYADEVTDCQFRNY